MTQQFLRWQNTDVCLINVLFPLYRLAIRSLQNNVKSDVINTNTTATMTTITTATTISPTKTTVYRNTLLSQHNLQHQTTMTNNDTASTNSSSISNVVFLNTKTFRKRQFFFPDCCQREFQQKKIYFRTKLELYLVSSC